MRILLVGSRETGHPLGVTLQKRGHDINYHFGEEDGFGDIFECLNEAPQVLKKTDAIIIHGNIFPNLQLALKTFRNHFNYEGQILVCRSHESPYTKSEVLAWGATAWYIHLAFRHQGENILNLLTYPLKLVPQSNDAPRPARRTRAIRNVVLDKATSILRFAGTYIRLTDEEAHFLNYVLQAAGSPVKAIAMEGIKFPDHCAYSIRLKMDRVMSKKTPFLQSSGEGYSWKG